MSTLAASSRRDFLLRSVGGVTALSSSALLLDPTTLRADAGCGAPAPCPFPSYFQNLLCAARDAYVQAGAAESMPPGYVGWANRSLMQEYANACVLFQYNIDASYPGLFDQVASSPDTLGNDLNRANPFWTAFAHNAGQVGLQNDFFYVVDTMLASECIGGLGHPVPIASNIRTGTDIRNDLQTMGYLSSLFSQQIYSRNFSDRERKGLLVPARFQPRFEGRLIPAWFESNSGNNALMAAVSGGLAKFGLDLVKAAGGLTALTGGGVVGGTVGTVAAWTGVGLIVLGVVGLCYVAYRIYTQQTQSGCQCSPWAPTGSPGDPVYRWRNAPPLYPPQLPLPAPPETRSVTYNN